MSEYTLDGPWLILNGEKVLYLVGMNDQQRNTLKDQYNAELVAPKVFIDYSANSWDEVKRKRDGLLSLCDWTQLLDAVLTNQERLDWQLYRQALRDIPQTFSSPELVVWPEEPNG